MRLNTSSRRLSSSDLVMSKRPSGSKSYPIPKSKPVSRWEWAPPDYGGTRRAGETYSETLTLGCTDESILANLGRIATLFGHLEDQMALALAVMMGSDDETAARYIYRSIVSTDAKTKTMRRLLGCPINQKLDTYYDDALTEFEYICGRRNLYMHGLWATRSDGAVFIVERPDGEYLALARKRRRVTSGELEGLLKRMMSLHLSLAITVPADLAERRGRRSKHAQRDTDTSPSHGCRTNSDATTPPLPKSSRRLPRKRVKKRPS